MKTTTPAGWWWKGQNTSTNSANDSRIYFTRARPICLIWICAWSWWYHLSSHFSRVKTGLFTKSNSASFMHRCGAMIISWKICSWFDRNIVHKFWFTGKYLVLVICEAHSTIDLLYFPWQPQRAQWLQGVDMPLACFFVVFKARCL